MTYEDSLALTVDQLAYLFTTMRDNIKKHEAGVAEQLKPHKEQLEMLRRAMHAKLNEMGANSVKTDHGTPYISTTSTVKMVDWEAFFNFVNETQEPDFLIKNANQTKTKQWLDETGQLPPGLEISHFQTLNVRS